MALIFYDTETTGTETFYDQILQFAAIKTDAYLNELDRFEIRCRLSPYCVPAPGAMRVTGINLAELTDPSLPSQYDMAMAIREKMLEWSPGAFIGYNSIRFDETLLRQTFYKSLLPLYLTNTNGNNRADVMRMVQAASLYEPDALTPADDGSGRTSFKLEFVAPANGFNHVAAHDAMGDVEATVHLARLLAGRAPDVWSSFMRFGSTAAVTAFAEETSVFSFSDFYTGRPYSWHVTLIGRNASYGAELYVFNLEVDPEDLDCMADDELTVRVDIRPKPVRRLRGNSCPMIMPAEDAPGISGSAGLPLQELERRAAYLADHPNLRERLIGAFESLHETYPVSPYVEGQIYDGFFNADQSKLDAFHATPWEQRLPIVHSFSDARLRELGIRLIHAERPDVLDKATCAKLDIALAERLTGKAGEVPWLTLPTAIEQIEALIQAASPDELAFLEEHKGYLASRLDHYARLLA
jgi:exodeoxyribonuclease-1